MTLFFLVVILYQTLLLIIGETMIKVRGLFTVLCYSLSIFCSLPSILLNSRVQFDSSIHRSDEMCSVEILESSIDSLIDVRSIEMQYVVRSSKLVVRAVLYLFFMATALLFKLNKNDLT
jgi:hypothetical protein